jgi:hypothetical protein
MTVWDDIFILPICLTAEANYRIEGVHAKTERFVSEALSPWWRNAVVLVI